MLPAQSNSAESISVKDFSDLYNQWLRELTLVEKSLTVKATEIQNIQNSLAAEAETLKDISTTFLPLQVEQNSLHEYVTSLSNLQDEMEQEILAIAENESNIDENESEECDECPVTIEGIENELQKITNVVKNTVNKINSELTWYEKSKSPLTKFRIIMDRYTDALQLIETNTAEIQEKLDELNSVYLQYYINADAFP